MLNIAELVPLPESVPIPFDSAIHGIPGVTSNSALTQFPEFRTGIGRNSGNRMELIPQCSTSWNRMTARYTTSEKQRRLRALSL
jgi:hypothetical protein